MSYLGSRGQRPLYRRAWNFATANIRFFSRRQFGDNISCSFVRCAKQKLIPAVRPSSDMHDSCNLFSVLSLPYFGTIWVACFEESTSWKPVANTVIWQSPTPCGCTVADRNIHLLSSHITPATFLMWRYMCREGCIFFFWGQVCWSKAHYAVGFLTSALQYVYIPKTELVPINATLLQHPIGRSRCLYIPPLLRESDPRGICSYRRFVKCYGAYIQRSIQKGVHYRGDDPQERQLRGVSSKHAYERVIWCLYFRTVPLCVNLSTL